MFRILLFISLLCYCKVFCDELNDDSSEFFDKFLDVLLNCDCADEYGVSSENEDGMYLLYAYAFLRPFCLSSA